MVLLPIWHSAENAVSVKDEAFNSATDSFIVKLEGNCSRFSLPIKSVEVCQEVATFKFDTNCSIPSGEYSLSLHNNTLDEELLVLKVKMYPNKNVCIDCSETL